MRISITRLRLRRLGYLPAFTLRNFWIIRQLRAAPGFMGGQTGVENVLTYWTLTGWADEASMREFRNHQAHGAAMPKLLDWCDETSVAHTIADKLLTWEEAYALMRDQGRVTPVRNPSPRHLAQKTVPDTPHFYRRFTTTIAPALGPR